MYMYNYIHVPPRLAVGIEADEGTSLSAVLSDGSSVQPRSPAAPQHATWDVAVGESLHPYL